jgi:hypothetical protein
MAWNRNVNLLNAYLDAGASISTGQVPQCIAGGKGWGVWNAYQKLVRKRLAKGGINVCYGDGRYVSFIPNEDNIHQALALACFLYQIHRETAWVSAIRVSGDEFIAHFRKRSNNTVSYTTFAGPTVTFAFAEALE